MQKTDDGRVILSEEDYAVLGEGDFGMPGLRATESIGPFVECQGSGPLIMVHDALVEPHLGIGHHPHRMNERLFYILRGSLDHDDALNGIKGHMGPNDLGRLTEGRRGMYHKEWNNGDEQTRAYILVYQTDPVPPQASFAALRDGDAPRYEEAPGVRTKELVGPRSPLEINGAIDLYTDSEIEAGSSLAIPRGTDQSLLLFALEGAFTIDDAKLGEGETFLVTPESGAGEVTVSGQGRLLRVLHAAGNGLEFGRPYERG